MTDKVRDKVRIEISPDKLRAYLEISIPTIVQWPSFAELIQFLEEAGVKYGIDTDLLRKILRIKPRPGSYCRGYVGSSWGRCGDQVLF